MKDKREKDEIVIVFDQCGLDEYLKEWKKLYPKRRKMPIENPMVRSLNKMLVITNRIVQNTHKQNYKEYGEWVVRKHGFEMLGICKTDLHIHLTFPTRVRHDLDNYVSKELMDSFTEIGLLIDDSYEYVNSITTTAEYQKGVTKMVFTFKNCKYDKELLEIQQEKEKVRKEKRDKTMEEKKSKKRKKKA